MEIKKKNMILVSLTEEEVAALGEVSALAVHAHAFAPNLSLSDRALSFLQDFEEDLEGCGEAAYAWEWERRRVRQLLEAAGFLSPQPPEPDSGSGDGWEVGAALEDDGEG